MVVVTEFNIKDVLYEILTSELIKSISNEECKILITSPWLQDIFFQQNNNTTSNFVDLRGIQQLSDIMIKLRKNNVRICILTQNVEMLTKQKWATQNTRKEVSEFYKKMSKIGVEFYYINWTDNHAKGFFTSQGCLLYTGNFTNRGTEEKQGNNGNWYSRIDDEKSCTDLVEWWEEQLTKCDNGKHYFSK